SVRVLPRLNQAGLNGVALELSGKTDTISATGKAVGAPDAAAEVTTPIASLRGSLLGEIIFEASDVGDARDLGAGAEARSAQRNCHVAIAEEYDMGVQQRSGLEDPRAVCRDAVSRLQACNSFLAVSNLLPAGPLGCGQPPQLTLRPGRSLHLMT